MPSGAAATRKPNKSLLAVPEALAAVRLVHVNDSALLLHAHLGRAAIAVATVGHVARAAHCFRPFAFETPTGSVALQFVIFHFALWILLRNGALAVLDIGRPHALPHGGRRHTHAAGHSLDLRFHGDLPQSRRHVRGCLNYGGTEGEQASGRQELVHGMIPPKAAAIRPAGDYTRHFNAECLEFGSG
jgi:hypothetical protein